MRTSLAAFTLLLATGLVVACTDDDTNGNTLPNVEQKGLDGGADGSTGSCSATGSGLIDMTVTGVPAGASIDLATPIIHFKSAAGEVGAVQTGQVSAAAGAYSFTGADILFTPDPVVRTAYSATVTPTDFCVADGKATPVSATYAAIPSSNKLWTTNSSASGQVIAFGGSSLGVTGTPAAGVAMKGPAGNSIAFDKDGNMYTLRGAVNLAPIQRYAASTLGTSGDKTPEKTFNLDAGCIPGLTQLAFGPNGDLFVSSACGKKISRLKTTDLAQAELGTGSFDAFTGLNAPEGMAFDKAGNLWVADAGAKTLVMYDAARIAGTDAAGAPTLTITPETEAKGDLAPSDLAFDASGNLWATSFGGNFIYRIAAADLTGTGAKTLVPPVLITLPVNVLLEGIAFDEGGGLWTTLSAGKIGRIAPTQLGTSTNAGSPTIPEVIITSADIEYTKSLAFFPPPASSPIYGH